MVDASSTPGRGLVAAIAVLSPTLSQVIRIIRALQILLVARRAFDRRAAEVAYLGSRVAAKTGDRRVRAHERKARAVMHGNLFPRNPVVFTMALTTACTELAAVNVLMATHTASSGEDGRGAPVIVAAKTLG
jgi:hypothetical protein